jgi:hypothetical protein
MWLLNTIPLVTRVRQTNSCAMPLPLKPAAAKNQKAFEFAPRMIQSGLMNPRKHYSNHGDSSTGKLSSIQSLFP